MLFLWVAFLALPDYGWGVGLDDSWEQALGFFLKGRAHAGRDYIFTFGPLGYFFTTAYDPDLFWAKYAWEIFLKLAMALSFAALLPGLQGRCSRILLCVLAAALLGPGDRSARDVLYALFLLVIVLRLCRQNGRPGLVLGGAVLLAVLAQVKFSLLILGLLYMPACVLALIAGGHRRLALLAPVLFGCAWLGCWLALGQSLANIPDYFRGGLEIAVGFNQAMALEGSGHQGETPLALAILGTLAAAWFTSERRAPGSRLSGVMLGASLFLQWKQGFTRHDGAHAAAFFSYTVLVPFILMSQPGPAPARRMMPRVLTWAAMALSLAGLWSAERRRPFSQVTDHEDPRTGVQWLVRENGRRFMTSAASVSFPWRLRSRLEAMRPAVARAWQLPWLRDEVHEAPVDLLSYMSGLLRVNQLHWGPRPVFQSYSAYTPYLLRANANFFRSSRAPEFVVLWLTPLDGRFPASEDAAALLELLHSYKPVAHRDGLVLLRRLAAQAPEEAGDVLLDQTARFGETVSFPRSAVRYETVSIQVGTSLWGMFRSALYRPSPLELHATTNDGHERTYRFIPALFGDGVLINPLLEDNGRALDLFAASGARVVAIRVTGGPGYSDEIRICLTARPSLVPRPLSAPEPDRLRSAR